MEKQSNARAMTPMDISGRTATVPAITTPVTNTERRKNLAKFKSRFIASSAP